MNASDKLAAERAAVRKVLQYHGLTKHGDAVVEADLIAALAAHDAEAKPETAEPVAYVDRPSLLWLTDKSRTPEAHIGTYLYKTAPGDGWVGVHLAAPAAPADTKDAERYRWLLDNCVGSVAPEGFVTTQMALTFVWDSPTWKDGQRCSPVPLDAAIDAAIAASNKEKA